MTDEQTAGTFVGLNQKGWGPLTLQPCQCKACIRIRALNEGRESMRKEVEGIQS